MLDLGWSELLIIGVVALIVVGPKDLPKMFRTLGNVTGKARAMAREFQRAMDSAADDMGVKGIKDTAQTLRETASGKTLRDAVGFDDLDREMRDIGKNSAADGAKTGRRAKPAAADPGGDLEARNAEFSHTEAERLKRAERAAEARRKAAEIRARRAAEAEGGGGSSPSRPAAEATAARNDASPEPAPGSPPSRAASPDSASSDDSTPRA